MTFIESNQPAKPNSYLSAENNRFKNRLVQRSGAFVVALAIIIPSSYTLLKKPDTLEVGVQLGIHNIAVISGLNQETPLNYHQYDARTAIDQTFMTYHLGNGFYKDERGVTSTASAWHMHQVLQMYKVGLVLDNQNETNHRRLGDTLYAIDTYWNDKPSNHPAGFDANYNFFGIGKDERFVDDNLWFAQFYLDQFFKTNDEMYLNQTKQIMNLFIEEHPYWKSQFSSENNKDKPIVANAPAIKVLVDMYLAGYGGEEYRQVAEETYAWLQQLRDPETGLYFDKFKSNGEIDTNFYTYVQGQMLEAMISMNKLDPKKHPMATATSFAHTALDHFELNGGYGNPAFDSILLPSLMRFSKNTNNELLILKTQKALRVADNAKPSSPDSVSDAAGAATMSCLLEMPLDRWSQA